MTINFNRSSEQKLARFYRDRRGALNEFLGLILFLVIVFGVLIPGIVELLAYTGQSQELDRLTKLAAKRACSLMPKADMGVAKDIKQGSLGVGAGVDVMQGIVDAVFREASIPETYFENGLTDDQGQKHIELHLFDYLGKEIDQGKRTKIGGAGREQEVILVGTNSSSGLCPSGGAKKAGGDWKYCMDPSKVQYALDSLGDTGLEANADLIARMERMQAGRCKPGEDCKQDFAGRLDRCTVCARKTRQSIFKGTLFGGILACQNANSKSVLLPCSMSTCATERFNRFSATRGLAPSMRSNINLGNEQYQALEKNAYDSASNKKKAISQENTRIPNYDPSNPDYNFYESLSQEKFAQ